MAQSRETKARKRAEADAKKLDKRRRLLVERASRLMPGLKWAPHPWRSSGSIVCAQINDGRRLTLVDAPSSAVLTLNEGGLERSVKWMAQGRDVVEVSSAWKGRA